MSDGISKETLVDLLKFILEKVEKAKTVTNAEIEMARPFLEPIWVDGQPCGWQGLEPIYYKFEFYLSGLEGEA